jgi:hypothetical protein
VIYDVLVTSLRRSYRSHATKWVRGISANTLSEACRIAEARHPNLGITPTITSMAWPVWPQPPENVTSGHTPAPQRSCGTSTLEN